MRSTPRCEQFVHDEICLVHGSRRRETIRLRFESLALLTSLTSLTSLTVLAGLNATQNAAAVNKVNPVNEVNKVNSIARKSNIPNGYRYA